MRLFVAAWPPPPVVSSLRTVVASMHEVPGAGALRWTAPEQWHVTLRFFGNADLDEVRAAFRSVVPPVAPVDVQVGPDTGRFGRRVLHVPLVGLGLLAAAVFDATAGVGQPPDDRPFAGHLTLARAKDRRGADLRPWSGVPVTGEWVVDELTLVSSRTDRAGATYEVVDRLPLR